MEVVKDILDALEKKEIKKEQAYGLIMDLINGLNYPNKKKYLIYEN